MIHSKENRRFQIFCHVCLILMTLLVVLPFLLVFISSITEENTLIANGYSFFPEKVSLYAYQYILRQGGKIFRAFGISVLVTIIGTLGNMMMSSMIAYPLSVKDLPYKRAITFYVFFTMLFNGGIVPQYMLWSNFFHIKNTIFALLVPNLLMGAFYIIMMRSYFTANIPDALGEAARIDGAGEFRILFQIVMPISKPMVATLGLMSGLAYWNDWINGLYYITNEKMFTMQNILNRMLQDAQFLTTGAASNMGDLVKNTPLNGIKMAIAVVGVIPILIIYPFVQKYLVQGITVGAVKG